MNTSADEDADLRDLVAHTLENNGVLGKIKVETLPRWISCSIVPCFISFNDWFAFSKHDHTVKKRSDYSMICAHEPVLRRSCYFLK